MDWTVETFGTTGNDALDSRDCLADFRDSWERRRPGGSRVQSSAVESSRVQSSAVESSRRRNALLLKAVFAGILGVFTARYFGAGCNSRSAVTVRPSSMCEQWLLMSMASVV